MKYSKPSTRKLQVECLEDRCLTAGLSLTTSALSIPASSPQIEVRTAAINPAAGAQAQEAKSIVSNGQSHAQLGATAISVLRGVDAGARDSSSVWISGLRINHNETLVRVRRSRARR